MVSDLIRTHETPIDRPDWIERRRKPRTGTGKREAYRRRSLFAEILDFMFAPLALLWPLSVVLTFVVARALADVPFDAELEQRLRALANYVEITGSYRPPDSFDAPRGLLALEETQQSAFQVRSAAVNPSVVIPGGACASVVWIPRTCSGNRPARTVVITPPQSPPWATNLL